MYEPKHKTEARSRVAVRTATRKPAQRDPINEGIRGPDGPAAGEPAQAGRSLLRLQQEYGNRYVRRMLATASQAHGEAEVDADVEAGVRGARGGGQALDGGVRAQMEPALGADFSAVRVHQDARADALSRSLNARAFTTGQDVFFRQGTYSPGSSSGRELLAHELTHVVQQTGGKEPGELRTKLTVSRPGDRFEQEADQVAKAVMQRERQPEAVRRAAEEEEETAQTRAEETVQRQEEEKEEEETAQTRAEEAVQRQEEEKDKQG